MYCKRPICFVKLPLTVLGEKTAEFGFSFSASLEGEKNEPFSLAKVNLKEIKHHRASDEVTQTECILTRCVCSSYLCA